MSQAIKAVITAWLILGLSMPALKRSQRNTSGFKGVTWHKRWHHWEAKIRVNHRTIHLGTFKTPEAAHTAYCKAADDVSGEFARAA